MAVIVNPVQRQGQIPEAQLQYHCQQQKIQGGIGSFTDAHEWIMTTRGRLVKQASLLPQAVGAGRQFSPFQFVEIKGGAFLRIAAEVADPLYGPEACQPDPG